MFTMEDIFLIYVHTDSYVHAQMCAHHMEARDQPRLLLLMNVYQAPTNPALTHLVGLCAANPGILHLSQSPQYWGGSTLPCPTLKKKNHVCLSGQVSWHMCRGQKTTLGVWFPPAVGSGDGTWVVKAHRLCGFYPPGNLAQTQTFLREC